MSSTDVIIPCYRYGNFLQQCVESVLSQDGPRIRVLIIDDASPDNTPEIATELARQDSRVTVVRHSRNVGHIATYNEGIEWASAEYMLLLSADDYLLPGALRRSATLMDDHPEIGFTFGNVFQLTATGVMKAVTCLPYGTGTAKYRIFSGLDFIRISKASNIVPTATAVVRTMLQKRVGGYRTELPHSGDMEMWFRLATGGAVGCIEEYQAVYRQHGHNMSHAYTLKDCLPDVQHRKLALDLFFDNSGVQLPCVENLRREAYRALACDTIAFASAAFNNGRTETTQELESFAVSVSSQVTASWPWVKLRLKRVIGLSTWSLLCSAVAMCKASHRGEYPANDGRT